MRELIIKTIEDKAFETTDGFKSIVKCINEDLIKICEEEEWIIEKKQGYYLIHLTYFS